MGSEHRTIPLGDTGLVALVDPEDYLRLNPWKWHVEGRERKYAYRYLYRGGKQSNGQYRKVRLAREITKAPAGVVVRFVNGDTLDCRKANLRACGGYVYFTPERSKRNPYRVFVTVNGGNYYCGAWPTARWAEEARKVAVEAASVMRGRNLSRKAIQRALDLATGREVRAKAA